MHKSNRSATEEQMDLFAQGERVTQRTETECRIYEFTPPSRADKDEDRAREKKALEIVRSLSRHLSIWD